eukprot:180745_1
MANALEILQAEYEAEDSQTLVTRTTFDDSQLKQVQSLTDDEEEEDIDDTVVYNNANDTMIEHIIHQPRYSGSVTSTATMITSPAGFNKMPFTQTSNTQSNAQSVISNTQIGKQPSTDFFAVVENMQKELNQKDKALKLIAKQLKEKNAQCTQLRTKSEMFKQQLQNTQNT